MTKKKPISGENLKNNGQHKNATKNFVYTGRSAGVTTTIQLGVVKPVYAYPTFLLTAKAV